MAWFNIVTENHGDTDSAAMALAPPVRYLRQVLGANGHEVTVTYDQIYPRAINLWLENFRGPKDYAQQFRDLRRKHGARVGVIATELIVGGVIPYDVQGVDLMGAPAERQKSLMRERVAKLNAVVGEIDFLWSFLQRTAEEYAGRCAISDFLPVGFTGAVAYRERRSPKDIDVFFFGRATRHRAMVLNRFADTGLSVAFSGIGMPGGWAPDYIVESMLDRAKIGLNLTLQSRGDTKADPRFASCFRVKEMLERGVCVVSEDIPLDNPYREFVTSSAVEDIADTCRRLISAGEWEALTPHRTGAFQKTMDAAKIAADIVAKAVKT